MSKHLIIWKPFDRRYVIPDHKLLLFSMLEAGIHVEHKCLEGYCRACVTILVEGSVEYESKSQRIVMELDHGQFLPCVCRPRSEKIVMDLVRN